MTAEKEVSSAKHCIIIWLATARLRIPARHSSPTAIQFFTAYEKWKRILKFRLKIRHRILNFYCKFQWFYTKIKALNFSSGKNSRQCSANISHIRRIFICNRKPLKQCHHIVSRALAGAGDRTWTGTMLPPRDFKSLASAYSATPAYVSATVILYITAAVLSIII